MKLRFFERVAQGKEGWRAVVGWPGYFVNVHGTVLGPRRFLKALLKGTRSPYPSVCLTSETRSAWVAVHLIVARAFLGEAQGREVDHVDGNRMDPALYDEQGEVRLEYVDKAENVRRSVSRGLSLKTRREIAELARKARKRGTAVHKVQKEALKIAGRAA